jgi:hypothetical protein
MELDK